MTDFTITISNGLFVLGEAPANLWGVLVWGTDNWGTNNDKEFLIDKALSNSLTATESQSVSVDKTITTQSVGVASDLPTLTLSDAAGFIYVFPSNSNNAASNPDTTYSQVASSSGTWTTFPINAATWSDA